MRDIEYLVAPPPHWCQCCRAYRCESDDAHNAADHVGFLQLCCQQRVGNVEVDVQRGVCIKEDRDDVAKVLMEAVERFVGATS